MKKGTQLGIGSFVAIGTLVGMIVGAVNYFQTDVEAAEAHQQIAEDSERGRLNNELKVTQLEVDYLLEMGEANRSEKEQARLEYLQRVIEQVEERLRELAETERA